MKKVILSLGLCFFLTLGFALDANAWWWKKHSVTCTATNTITISIAGQSIEFNESWEGTKDVCRSGNDWCLSSSCA